MVIRLISFLKEMTLCFGFFSTVKNVTVTPPRSCVLPASFPGNLNVWMELGTADGGHRGLGGILREREEEKGEDIDSFVRLLHTNPVSHLSHERITMTSVESLR